jgi:hypothetical protein
MILLRLLRSMCVRCGELNRAKHYVDCLREPSYPSQHHFCVASLEDSLDSADTRVVAFEESLDLRMELPNMSQGVLYVGFEPGFADFVIVFHNSSQVPQRCR